MMVSMDTMEVTREECERAALVTGGLREVAEILGWRTQRLSNERRKASRGEGMYVDMPRAVGGTYATPLFYLPEWEAYARELSAGNG